MHSEFNDILGGLVHQVRQPLSVIESCACYLQMVLPEEAEPVQEQLARISVQVDEVNRLLVEAIERVRSASV